MRGRREQLPHSDAHDQGAVHHQEAPDEQPDGEHWFAVVVHIHLRLSHNSQLGIFMSCQTTVRHSGNVAILDLDGNVTMSSGIGVIRDAVKTLVDGGHKNILLNLAGVAYMDSSGLGEMAGTYITVANMGGCMKLVNAQSRVDGLLHVTRLY